MVRRALALVVLLVSSLVAVLLVEGAHALWRWKHLDGSIVYQAHRALRDALGTPSTGEADPAYTRLLGRAELEAALPELAALDAGVGNSPYDELRTAAAALNERIDGCLTQKPNLAKRMTFLRTNAFNPFDPPALFFDAGRAPGPAVQALVDRYGVRTVMHTSNAHGERTTVPAVDAGAVVLVAGDSVANGAMVSDEETLSSRLQSRDGSRRYVNVGVGNADASDALCALERALDRYARTVVAIVYVYCENDLIPGAPYGDPDAAIERLATLARGAGVGDVAVVYAPFVDNIVPQYTRLRGYSRARSPTHARERARVAEQAGAAGFRHLDIADLALDEMALRGSQFAALALFVDHVHLSPYGAGRLAGRLLER